VSTEYPATSRLESVRASLRAQRTPVADLALLLTTLIWGSTFVMVKDAVTSYPVFSFLALRFVFAIAIIAPLAWLARAGKEATLQSRGNSSPYLRYVAPLVVGIALFAGFAFQTLGLQLTTPAKTGFITGLSVVLVPLAAALVFRQTPGRNAWLGVGLAVVGLALLSLEPGMRANPGDLLVFGCSVAFAAQILLMGYFAPRCNALTLTLGQFAVVAVLSGVAAFAFESPPPLTGGVLFAAVFTGVLATSLAFGIQTVAQRFTSATHTALIFAAEPVFAALFSFLLIGEVLGSRQVIGCGLILGGMLVAELKRKT
jgi:drug/metabolite transporter (DMT)-like permease